MLILIIAGGPDKGRIYELDAASPIVLGREGDQVKLNDRKVSREHARLWCEGGQWYLEDLGSRHGTYRNHTPIEPRHRAKIKDGDYLQIGNTVMVLGRMPAEHAEKLALLAEQHRQTPSNWRRPLVIAGGVSVAALLGLGVYLAVELNSMRGEMVTRDQMARLEQQLIDAQRAELQRQLVEAERAEADRNRKLIASLNQTTDAIDKHGSAVAQATEALGDATKPILARLEDVNTIAARQQLAIERLGEMLADQQSTDNSAQLLTAVKEIKALMADQPSGDVLVAKLEAAIKTNADAAGQAVRFALAEHRGQTPGSAVASSKDTDALLNRILEQLAQVPTQEQIAEQVRLAVAESNAQGEQFMRLVLAELRSTGDQITTDVAAAIDQDTQQTQAFMQNKLAEKIAGELRAMDNESAVRTAALLEKVLEKVNEQQALTSQVAQLRDQIESLPGRSTQAVREVLARLDAQDRNNAAMLGAIAELRATMPDDLPGQLDQVLAKLDQQVRTEQITNAIERSVQRIAAAKDEQTQAAIAALSQRLDALPTSDQIGEVLDSQEALAKLLDQSDARSLVAELRTSLEQLATQLPKSPDDKLTQVIAMLKEREKADLLLAELHDAVGNQSEQTAALKQELLATINKANDAASGETLQELLALVQERLATDESVRQVIREEMRGTVIPNQMAITDARDVTTTFNPTSDEGTGEQTALPRQRLTRLEQAYKRSFETGQAVTVGAGVVDPNTGAVSEGRLIDPAVAKTLGFENWRDWYLTDRHAEQMRLQQQALQQRNENDAQSPGTISLPPVKPDSNPTEQN